MPIEEEVNSIISALSKTTKKIAFLCGSSGDGKSEMLTRCKKKLDSRVKFHLDATHPVHKISFIKEFLQDLRMHNF